MNVKIANYSQIYKTFLSIFAGNPWRDTHTVCRSCHGARTGGTSSPPGLKTAPISGYGIWR